MRYSSGVSLLFVAVACVSVALPSFSQTGETYTLNVLGFQKLAAPSNNYQMVSVPFEAVSNELNEVIGRQLTPGTGFDTSDDILIWDANNQSYTQFWRRVSTGRWCYFGTTRTASNILINPGHGMWFYSRQATDQTVVVAGDVVDAAVMTNRIVPGFQMLAYPFSTPIRLVDTTLTNGLKEADYGSADNVMIWDASSQSYSQYWLRAASGRWTIFGGTRTATNAILKPGEAFWYNSKGTNVFEWVEARPYTL
jgi:hypothetical protein